MLSYHLREGREVKALRARLASSFARIHVLSDLSKFIIYSLPLFKAISIFAEIFSSIFHSTFTVSKIFAITRVKRDIRRKFLD